MLLNILLSLLVIPALGQDFLSCNGSLDLAANMAETEQAPQRIYSDVLDVKITAKSAIAVDAKTGAILYKNNAQEIRPMASITKLMTALVFLDYNPGWQKEVFTIASDRRNGGIIHLNTGEVMTIKDLFYTALIASDNDAAMALARSTGLDENEFHMIIYDRWGEKIYETYNYHHGWDGRVKNKSMAKTGAYPWIIFYKDLNGKPQKETGSVIVIDN